MNIFNKKIVTINLLCNITSKIYINDNYLNKRLMMIKN